VAALNHPNIVTIHSVEEADGVHFLTMELVEGEALGKVIPPKGLDVDRFFELALPLAGAVSAAHERGITHRDLKPANVMVGVDGRLKILDFGLAKLQQPEDDSLWSELPTEAKTREGIIVGTIPYMSPEQIEGKAVDQRTDVFSLGIILYQMATGRRPFQGKSSPALMSAILKDTPPSVTDARRELPLRLGSVISRCLAKSPVERYSAAGDVLEELRALREASPSLAPSARTAESTSARGFWVAVLPFKHRGDDPDVEALAEGLSEDITTGLSKFSYLNVVSRSSTHRHKDPHSDAREVGKELGARYVMAGGIRRAGSKVRINVQLLDTLTGMHLWAENFDRNLESADLFDVQDEITDRTVATVADPYGVLVRSMAAPTDGRPPETLTPYESVLRFFLYQHRVAPEDHFVSRIALERAVELEPRYADAWAALTIVFLDEDRHAFNPRPKALDRALQAAQRAIDADPANPLAHYALAQAHYFRADMGAFRSAAERAISINHRDGNAMAMLGILMGYAGDWERGVELTTTAMKLNPHHPGWYWFTTFFDLYRNGRYKEALATAQKINLPDYFPTHYTAAIAHARLGNMDGARAAAKETLRLWPEFEDEFYERHIRKWMPSQPELIEQVVEGLELAGLRVRRPGQDALRKAGLATGTSARAVTVPPALAPAQEPAVAIAVVPFSDMSSTHDQEYLCEGMAEEIMNALVRTGGIHVASRTSAFRARNRGMDLAAVGRALSVGHVLEGSVRIAGNRLRVTAQLIEVASGYQLWSERFERGAEDVFALQDDIARGVVEAVRARLNPEQQTVRPRPQVKDLEAYRHYLMGRYLRYTKNDHGNALRRFKQAVALDPSHAPSWLGLAELMLLATVYSLVPAREAHATAKEALATAATLDGESAEGLYVEGMIAFAVRDWRRSEQALRRAIELQPNHVQAKCWLGMLLSVLGRNEEAMPVFQRARDVDPLAPYPYAMTGIGLLNRRRPAEAGEYCNQALDFEKENNLALWLAGTACMAQGNAGEAIALLERACTPSHHGGFVHGILGWALAEAGRAQEATDIFVKLRSRPESAPTVISQAWLLASLGDKAAAFDVLERAEKEWQPLLPLMGLPGFDPLRADPRFTAIQERIGLPPAPTSPSGEPEGSP
jgi:TolB-like protein/Flp pilus assembly protein TadD